MNKKTIAFIGGGNMATSLIGGLINGHVLPQNIWISEPDADKRQLLAARFGVRAVADNTTAAGADIVILAVKPQVMLAVAREIQPVMLKHKPLIITIAAGVRMASLARNLGDDLPIVRAMPNTPALLQTGATALIANAHVSLGQRSSAESIMRSVGLTLWLESEDLMDAVTAVSGSGPAYFFLLMEMLQEAAQQQGLDATSARLLVLQTALGAAKMALESDQDPQALRRQVTSPGGTTERAISTLLDGNIQDLFNRAVADATQRSRELAQLLEK